MKFGYDNFYSAKIPLADPLLANPSPIDGMITDPLFSGSPSLDKLVSSMPEFIPSISGGGSVTLERSHEGIMREKIREITGGHHIDFGPYLNEGLHEQNPETGITIKHAAYSACTTWNLDPNDIHPTGVEGSIMFDINGTPTEKDEKVITGLVNKQVGEIFPDVLKPDMTDFHKASLSIKYGFSDVYTPEGAEEYRQEKAELIKKDVEKIQSLYTPRPYDGERYKIEMDFSLTAPVYDIDKTVKELDKLPIEYIVMDQWFDGYEGHEDSALPRNIVGTNWKFKDEQHGTLQFEITNPLKDQAKAALNFTAYEFGKKGSVTKFFKEHDLVDMSKCSDGAKGKVFESCDRKFHEAKNDLTLTEDDLKFAEQATGMKL